MPVAEHFSGQTRRLGVKANNCFRARVLKILLSYFYCADSVLLPSKENSFCRCRHLVLTLLLCQEWVAREKIKQMLKISCGRIAVLVSPERPGKHSQQACLSPAKLRHTLQRKLIGALGQVAGLEQHQSPYAEVSWRQRACFQGVLPSLILQAVVTLRMSGFFLSMFIGVYVYVCIFFFSSQFLE